MRPPRLALYLDDGLVCGGTERVAAQLLAHWARRGWEVYLVARKPPQNGFHALPPGVVGLSLAPATDGAPALAPVRKRLLLPATVRSLLRLVHEALRLRRTLRHLDADVGVAFLTPANVKLLLAARGLRVRTVISERSDTRRYAYPRMWHVLRRWLYRLADVVSANTQASIQDMERYVPKSRLIFLPNPFEAPPQDALAYPAQSRRIVCVGRLVTEKRQDLLIQAFAALGPAFAEWQLDIVGEGPLRAELEQAIARHSLGRRAHLHGLSKEVDAHYRAGAIFVLPSSVEGTPNALLEAMGHGLPCIVSDSIAVARDYIEDGNTGFLFAAGSATDLARRLESLAAFAERRAAMGAAARRKLLAMAPGEAYHAWDRAITPDAKKQ